MNQRFGHFKEDFTPFIDHQTPVSMNVFFNFFNEIIIYQRWPTSPSFIKNVCFSCIKFMTPLCHFLTVHNITINTKNSTMYFTWSFSFGIEKLNNRTHFTLGRIWNWHSHFKLTQHTNTLLRTSTINAMKWVGGCQTQQCCHFHSSDSPPLPPILYPEFLDNRPVFLRASQPYFLRIRTCTQTVKCECLPQFNFCWINGIS